jgi:hypothetical protein
MLFGILTVIRDSGLLSLVNKLPQSDLSDVTLKTRQLVRLRWEGAEDHHDSKAMWLRDT